MIAQPNSTSFSAPPLPAAEPDASETRAPRSDAINILVVDDAPDKLLALETVLGDLGQNVVKAGSGTEALRHLLREEFAVILLDVNMPGMDGFEAAQLIRQRKATAHVPIIFVTSFSTADTDVFRGYSLGAVDYIFTPVVPEVLRSKVSVFLDLHRQRCEIQRQAEQLRLMQEERHQRQLVQANERIEWETRRNRFFNLSIELLGIANYRWELTQVNPTWEATLGFSEEELKSQPLVDLVHADDRPATVEAMIKILTGDRPAYFENRVRAKDGGYRWFGWTMAPFAAEELLYVFARDITERIEREAEVRSLNQALERHSSELQAANRELEEFSYSISHDLRGPLRAITGYSEILLTEHLKRLDSEGRQMVEAVSRNSLHLTKLIDDFLAFFRFGRAHVNAIHFDMKVLAQAAIDVVKPVSSNRIIEFRIGSLPAAFGDRAMLRQVFVNLLSNAVKFTAPVKNALIEIGTQNREGRPIYYVRDNGVGFNMRYYDKLFGVFQSLHKDEGFEGTGIGLALVHKIIRRHGGEIWAEGKVNEGATFFFTLGTLESAETPAAAG
ncbi:hybrid sensor histidine kinase/response regulator [Opitutaceae bacterium EW11]|nr:hybrid sensor histidine kinase/response regulator [Opitutaceae bacterium EW11]